MRRVFISYSSRDRKDALDLKALLESHGCEVWMDFFDIQPTMQLGAQLSDNVKRAEVVCLLLSPTAVASKWVRTEIEHALAQAEDGLRILPVLLRPCDIPDLLDELVGIDATAGLDNEATRLRLVKAVLGEGSVEDTVLLDKAYRSIMAARELQLQADRELPAVAAAIDRISREPIREISITVGDGAFPKDRTLVLELRLSLDELWNQPMSFFFARFREGRTWPEEFGLAEPPYTSFFLDEHRVDGKFRWYDRVEDLGRTIVGANVGELPPTFNLSFDGSEFRPTGGIHLPKKNEIPSLQELRDQRSEFTLIAHDIEGGASLPVDLSKTDVDVRVDARFPQMEPPGCRLFSSLHDRAERTILESEYLRNVENPIEREALLGHYSVLRGRRESKAEDAFERIMRLADDEEQEAQTEEEQRSVARLCFERATLAEFRGQLHGAFESYRRAANELFKIVAAGGFGYADAALLYRCCEDMVSILLRQRQFEDAARFVPGLLQVTDLMVEGDPSEPDYQRAWARARETHAVLLAETGRKDDAARALREGVEVWRRLCKEMLLPARLKDARDAMSRGLKYAERSGVEHLLPVEEWRQELGLKEGGQETDASGEATASAMPVWLEPAELESWPTRSAESPMLRYALRLRENWSAQPEVSATPSEFEHIYRGHSPAEWLIVSCMAEANPNSSMKTWVDFQMAVTGFPVLHMFSALEPHPELLVWNYEGTSTAFAEKLSAEEVHLYRGMAVLPGEYNRLAHIYIVMARRANFAWKVTLSFESACLPGMPESMVASNDHVRAGATFGNLRLL